MRSKTLIASLLLLTGITHAGVDLDAIANKGAELRLKQLDEAIKKTESNSISAPASNVQANSVSPTPFNPLMGTTALATDELKLLVIYGVGKDLMAKIAIGDRGTLPVRVGSKFETWTVSAINDNEVILEKSLNTKSTKKTKKSRKSTANTNRTITKKLTMYASGTNSTSIPSVPVTEINTAPRAVTDSNPFAVKPFIGLSNNAR
ncbi:hypothetical protein [Iodobacter fluviatilis]|uniref:Type IV pilus biogenesis protein PilP n=1 Tax=Iodobacter fluviatilis TaxID=537 RepID=A0A377Q8A8_9NEIS|nr:hypothetical protein [Iodobacter fluviatilis]TCU84625.1 type IV pilus biogenesis protein PilP [Iodobacter fluviatilis]STQ90091.1 type IV pilus biogenesis protein PilP [Iodobacter fluviatilis]